MTEWENTMRPTGSGVSVALALILGVSLFQSGHGQEKGLPPPAEQRISVNRVKQIEIGGDLRTRLDAIIDWEIRGRTACGFNDRWMINDVEHALPGPRSNEDFTGDVWGSYIETMAVLARITGKRYPEVDSIVQGVLSRQRPDGSFWNVVPADKDVPMVASDNHAWGWQRALIGLVEYYRTYQDEKVLRAAARLGDFLVKLYARSRSAPADSNLARTMRGSPLYPPSSYWSAVSQGFLGLYEITHDKKYLDAATQIADRVAGELLDVENTTDWLTWHGAMRLYEQTGKPDCFYKVQKNVQAVMRMMTVLGDTPHLWNWPKSNEACGLADSITLNCDLWRATLHPSYMDAVERVVYNAFFTSIYPRTGCGRYNYGIRVTGGGRHADPQEETGIRDCFVNVFRGTSEACCDWHVPLAFRDIVGQIFAKGEQPDVYVNLFIPSRAQFACGGAGDEVRVRLKQETEYPHGEDVVIRVEADSPVRFPLHVRIPYWCKGATVAVNSDGPIAAAAGQYVKLDRQWGHDVVRLRLPMRLRIESADEPWGRAANASHETVDRAILLKGPLVLALDADNNPNMAPLWDEAHVAGIRPALVVPAGHESLELPNDKRPIDKNRPFTYPASDYVGIWELASEPGRADGRLLVKGHLTPLAEVTGSPRASSVQFAVRVRAVKPAQYATQYATLVGDPTFTMTDQYGSFLKEVQATKSWASQLGRRIEQDKYSYDAVLAAQRLGRSGGDPAALKALVECLKTDNGLLQRTAVEAIRQLGKADEGTIGALQELANKTPELRGTIGGTLAALGRKMAPQGAKSMSWVQGPADARQYMIRKSLKIDRPEVDRVDIRLCSWDVYEVSINGQVAGVKPTWTHQKFVDLTPLLQSGENELLIRVIRKEKLPAEFAQTWTVGASSLPPGIIVKLRIQHRDRSEETVYTDASWTAAALPAATVGGDWIKNTAGLPWAPCAARTHSGGNPFAYGYRGD
jgi:DUF1680 family protein